MGSLSGKIIIPIPPHLQKFKRHRISTDFIPARQTLFIPIRVKLANNPPAPGVNSQNFETFRL